MPECAYINRLMNMPRVWQGPQYASVTQRSDYARICLDRVLNIS